MVDPNREIALRPDVEALYFGYRAFMSLPDRILAERGLGRAHHRVLYFVRREPGISLGALIGVLKITKQAAHRPVKDLEAAGLIVLEPDPKDRRVRRLSTTAAGAQLEDELTGAQARLLEAAFAGRSAAARENWRDIMVHLADLDR